VDWIHLAQDGDQWWALINVEMNLQVPYKAGNLTERLSASQEDSAPSS